LAAPDPGSIHKPFRNIIPGKTPEFLSPEWGAITPFALTEADRNIYGRWGYNYWVFHDPGDSPYIDMTSVGGLSEEYKWGRILVSIWPAHLDPTGGAMLDIHLRLSGITRNFLKQSKDNRDFYNLLEGGDPGMGQAVNPHTGPNWQRK